MGDTGGSFVDQRLRLNERCIKKRLPFRRAGKRFDAFRLLHAAGGDLHRRAGLAGHGQHRLLGRQGVGVVGLLAQFQLHAALLEGLLIKLRGNHQHSGDLPAGKKIFRFFE